MLYVFIVDEYCRINHRTRLDTEISLKHLAITSILIGLINVSVAAKHFLNILCSIIRSYIFINLNISHNVLFIEAAISNRNTRATFVTCHVQWYQLINIFLFSPSLSHYLSLPNPFPLPLPPLPTLSLSFSLSFIISIDNIKYVQRAPDSQTHHISQCWIASASGPILRLIGSIFFESCLNG